ncbi:neural cell adhesion molecule 1-like isoform X1 [Crassostrea angulata]|uniref:neural cell adhesion molecule 1-like isoform X1 n=1 Tax=Magallana angulata TaxID=2784310 RepID=UPI0022B1A28E|nr:neural cell adhesion molecule 1-like isoform X1 [Crassostrea angulata]
MLKYSCVLLFSLFLICGFELILKPETPAFVKKGQTLELTCQSNVPVGIYYFYMIDVKGRMISLGAGGGAFRSCHSFINQTRFECDFEEIWTFKLTLLNPIHNQTIECSGTYNRTLSINTTIFVQVPVSTLTLSTPQTAVRASRSINITCRTNDPVRPAANITWYKEKAEIFTQITTSIQHDANDLYRTVSVLQYTGVPEDNGQQVYCRASNIEGEHVESNRYTLNVMYIAEVQIFPVSSLNIVAGTKQVWLYCHVSNANQEIVSYRWTKSNSLVSTVVSSTLMYVIESAVEKDTGNYTCTAYNSAGNSSGTVEIYVQSRPMKPKIILVDCDVTSATILWTVSTSLNFRYTPPFQQETLQLSEQNEGFLNCSYEKIETNLSSVYIYRAPDLNPSTEYKFRIVASNVHGSSVSDSRACFTTGKPFASESKDCEKGFIIGGSLGGAFFLIILSGGSAFFIYLKINRKKQQRAKQNDHYVHHICSTNEHPYQDISDQNKGAVKVTERAEYMELEDTIYTNGDGQ